MNLMHLKFTFFLHDFLKKKYEYLPDNDSNNRTYVQLSAWPCMHLTWYFVILNCNDYLPIISHIKKMYLGFLLLFKHGFVSTFFAKFLQRFHCFTVGSPNDLVTIRIFFVLGLKITTGFLLPWDDFLFK